MCQLKKFYHMMKCGRTIENAGFNPIGKTNTNQQNMGYNFIMKLFSVLCIDNQWRLILECKTRCNPHSGGKSMCIILKTAWK